LNQECQNQGLGKRLGFEGFLLLKEFKRTWLAKKSFFGKEPGWNGKEFKFTVKVRDY